MGEKFLETYLQLSAAHTLSSQGFMIKKRYDGAKWPPGNPDAIFVKLPPGNLDVTPKMAPWQP